MDVFLILSTLVCPCLGWWERSHALVAEIARLQTPASVHQNLYKILSLDNESLPFHASWQQSSNFADELKTYKLFTMSEWHYIDYPIAAPGYSGSVIYPTPQNNAVWAGTELTNTARVSISPWAAAFAFRYIVHILGDLHQPLHASTLFSSRFPKGDQGGNSFVVNAQFESGGAIKNLHALWDSAGGLFNEGIQPIPFSQQFLEKTNVIAQQLIQEIDISGYNLSTNWAAWAQESYDLAVQFVYTDISYGESLNQNSSYIARAQQLCKQRIRLAGARLAYLLNSTTFSASVNSANALHLQYESNLQAAHGEGSTGASTGASTGVVVLVSVLCTIIGAVLGAFVLHIYRLRQDALFFRGRQKLGDALE